MSTSPAGSKTFRFFRRIVIRSESGLPRGEGHDATWVVADRDHQPAAKSRTERPERERSVFVNEKQSAAPQGFFGPLAMIALTYNEYL